MRYTTALLVSPRRNPCQLPAPTSTVERIFAAPDLSGPRLREPKFSPDGRYVTYLQGKPDNKDQLDLWAFDTRSGKSRLLVDSRALVSGRKAVGGGRSPARAAAHGFAARHRRVPVLRRRQAPADSARRRSVFVRVERASANPVTRLTAQRQLRDRRALLARRPLRQLHPRPEPVRDRPAHAPGARPHHRWRRTGAERRRGVRRAGRNGSRHRLLVVAGRFAHRVTRASTTRRCRKSSVSKSTPTARACIGSAIRPPAPPIRKSN